MISSRLARAHRRLEHFDAVAADALAMIHGELGVLEHLLGALWLPVGKRDPDRGGHENLAVVERDGCAQIFAHGFGEGDDALGVALRNQDQRILITGKPRQRVLRLQQPPQAARQGQQDRIADRNPERIVDLLEAVEIDQHDGRPDSGVGLGQREHALETIEEQLAIGQPGQIVVDRVMEQALLRVLELGDVGECAD